MDLKPGTRCKSAVCNAEVVIIRPPKRAVVLECGGHSMMAMTAERPTDLAIRLTTPQASNWASAIVTRKSELKYWRAKLAKALSRSMARFCQLGVLRRSRRRTKHDPMYTEVLLEMAAYAMGDRGSPGDIAWSAGHCRYLISLSKSKLDGFRTRRCRVVYSAPPRPHLRMRFR